VCDGRSEHATRVRDTNQHVKQYKYNIDNRVRARGHEKQHGRQFLDSTHPLLGYDWKNDGLR